MTNKYEDYIEIVEKIDENKMKNGFCVQKWKNGKKFTGIFLNNKIKGWAKLNNLEMEICGEFSDDFLNGYGEVINYVENKLYEGYWIQGVLGGVGSEKGENYIYLGNFITNQKEGYGKQIWDDMDMYEGEWKDNDFNGYGIYYYHNGKQYTGEWEKSCKSGFGELSYPEGKKYVGYFKNDSKNGFGIYYIKKGNLTINFWKDGKRHGLGKYFNNNTIYYQLWEDNELIKTNMNESLFMDSFDDDIKKYRNMFELNIDEIIKFLDVNE